jgi:hypothetical protein
MPDQLPAAILDSANSFDSLFALELDTKQRFDNILNNQQKPIDYPLPDYNKDFTPQGLPQDDLLNPQKMSGSIGEAMFSADPRIAGYATDKLRSAQGKLPVAQGIGVPDHFEYSKSMDKFLSGDWGYNPYQSIEDNEDFNYRYDYLSQGLGERIFKNVGVGLGRFVGSVLLKLGQTAGYMGSMVGNGIEEIFNSKENNFMADVADNSLSRWFEGLEEDMKNSSGLSVFKPKGWDDMGFFKKLGNGAFWTDEVADGAAFMGEMVASMYLMGGLGKIGGLGRLGATEINLTKALGKLGGAGRYAGRGLDFALKTATGAENISGIGRWAFATTSESAFEASQLYQTKKDQLKADRQEGRNSLTDMEIEATAGDAAAGSFKANMLILSASNAFENRFIFNPLFKKLGVSKPNPRGRLINVSGETDALENVARASRREYKYGTWIGKKLDWKNSNGRLRFYGSRGLSAIAAEGFWEENAQLAVERLSSADNLSFKTFAKKLKDQTIGALSGDDPEAATNIGLGGLIGIGGTSIVSKVAGGDKVKYKIDPSTGLVMKDAQGNPITEKVLFLQRGERRKIENDTATAVAVYEQYRRKFLNYQDIYVRDENGKPVLDSDGNMQIDDVVAAGILEGTNAFSSKQAAASKVNDPLFRKHLQDNAMMDFVTAAKNAGVFERANKRFNNLGDLSVGDLQNLGFDPNTVVDPVYLSDSLKQFGKIYDQVQAAPPVARGKADTQEDEESRKNATFKAKAGVYSATKILGEYQSVMMDRDFPSTFSSDAEANTSEVQAYNSLVFQKEALEQWADLAKEHGNFYAPFVRTETRRINEEMARLEAIMDTIQEDTETNLQMTPRGFVVAASKYDDYTTSGERRLKEVEGTDPLRKQNWRRRNDRNDSKGNREIEMSMDAENDAQRKHAQMTNVRNVNQYLASKFSSVENGMQNYKDYMKFNESIQDKDAKTDGSKPEATPPPNGPVNPNATPPTSGPTAPTTQTTVPPPVTSTPQTETQTIKAEEVITKLTGMMSNGRAIVIAKDPDNIPNYQQIADYVNENYAAFPIPVENTLMSFITDPGNIVLDQMRANTFDPNNNISLDAYRASQEFMDNLAAGIENEGLQNKLYDYLDSVDKAILEYKEVQVVLNDAENTAIQELALRDLATTRLAPYATILNDPNSTAQVKREALRYISDQLLATSTAEEVGTILGGRASEAIENLGYPVPQESADVADAVADGPVLATQALINSFADRIAKGEQMTDPDELQFYENNKEAIEARLKELQANETPTPPPTTEQQIADFFAGINADEGSKAKIREYADRILAGEDPAVVLEGLGPSFTGPVNELVALERASTPEPTSTEEAPLKEGDLVQVATKKDGRSTITELRGDKALLEDGRQVKLENLIKVEPTEGTTDLPPTNEELTEPETQAEEASGDTEGSGVTEDTPPPPDEPPTPPTVAENSDAFEVQQNNFIDVQVDAAKINGQFTFPQNQPEEIVMEGTQAKIVNGAIQLKTTTGDQQNQLLRQHNILKMMGDKNQPENFFSEDAQGNPKYKVKLEMAGFRNEAKYAPWVYDTGRGLLNQKTGKPNPFPFVVAMVTDPQGNYIYFDDNGNVSNKAKGKPFGFPYTIEDYGTDMLDISRRGAQLKTMEPLNGTPGYKNNNPLADLRTAIQRGVDLFGSIDMVTSGKLSTFNVDNSGATYAKTPQMRSVRELIDANEIDDNTPIVLTSGNYIEIPLTTASDTRKQNIKVGQAFIFDEKSGLKIPLRGKKIKDLTIGGEPFVTGQLRDVIEALSKDGKVNIPQEFATPENQDLMENFFNTVRALVYSRNTPILINDDRTQIIMYDNRPTNISLLETEVNFSTGLATIDNPFLSNEEGFSYDEFVKENFMTGAVPAELRKGEKGFEKLNQRVIFTLEKDHQQILDAIGSVSENKPSIRMQMTDFSKFVNKTYKRKGGTTTITVTGYNDGNFTIAGASGTVTQSAADFMKSLRGLEEVKLPTPTEDVQQDFENNIKLSQDEQRELNERAKNLSNEDIDNLDFNC